MKHKKIKNQKSPKLKKSASEREKIKITYQISKILKFLFIIIIYSLLFINLFSSQSISPLYTKLTNNEKKAVVEFLQKIKTLPQFSQQLEKYKKIYGEVIEEEVFAKERERKLTIKKLEQILEKNPKARDVLYSLYLLYEEDGNKIKAREYLRRAKEVDPLIHE